MYVRNTHLLGTSPHFLLAKIFESLSLCWFVSLIYYFLTSKMTINIYRLYSMSNLWDNLFWIWNPRSKEMKIRYQVLSSNLRNTTSLSLSSLKRHHIITCLYEGVCTAAFLNWWGEEGKEGLEVSKSLFFNLKEFEAQLLKMNC